MSSNLELTRRAYTAALERPYEEFLALLAEDVRIELPACLPHGGIYRGKDGAQKLRAALLRAWEKFDVQVLEYLQGADTVIAIIQLDGTLAASGAPVRLKIAEFWRYRHGLVSELAAFYFDTHAVVTALQQRRA
jgi:uncharacterized protein